LPFAALREKLSATSEFPACEGKTFLLIGKKGPHFTTFSFAKPANIAKGGKDSKPCDRPGEQIIRHQTLFFKKIGG